MIGRLPRLGASENIDWTGAHLERASLPGVDLSDAYMGWTHFQRLYLVGSTCHRTNFDHADLRGAILREVDLSEARITGAHLQGARLFRAKLPRADLRGTRLSGASLREVDLTGADLRGVDLTQVRGLTRQQLMHARTDSATRLPNYLEEFPGGSDSTS